MAILGVPNVGVLKLIDVHVELVIGVEVHVGNEEMPLALKEEKCCISLCPEPATIFLHEVLYLMLRKAESPYVRAQISKHL